MTVVEIRYPEKLYIGTQDLKPFDVKDSPLAFAIDGTKDDAAFKKQKKTVDAWCGDGGSWCPTTHKRLPPAVVQMPHHIPNDPVKGLSFMKAVSRWSTSNKFLRVQDPRGFELEISIENLMELFGSTNINRGIIADECVWGRAGGKVYLTTTAHPQYLLHKNPVRKEKTVLKVGDRVQIPNRPEEIFLGIFYAARVGITTESIQNPRFRNRSWQDRQALTQAGEWEWRYHAYCTLDLEQKEPFYVFVSIKDKHYRASRKPSKFKVVSESPETTVPLTISPWIPCEFNSLKDENYNFSYGHAKLFKNKEDLEAYNMDENDRLKFEGDLVCNKLNFRDIYKVEKWVSKEWKLPQRNYW